MSTRAVACELNVHLSTINWSFRRFWSFKAFQRIWQYIQPASQPQTTCIHTSPGLPHPASSPPRSSWDQPPGQLLQQSVCITKAFLHKLSETFSGKLSCMLVVLIGVSTWPAVRSFTTITSYCSMIMHGPILQGSVHNSWKLKTSQFLHDQYTHRTCHPLSMFGMLWFGIYDSVFQFLPNEVDGLSRQRRSAH